jgi:hypothetical protein
MESQGGNSLGFQPKVFITNWNVSAISFLYSSVPLVLEDGNSKNYVA